LGNPGPDYEATRHNVGYRIVDRLAGRHALPDWVRQDKRLQTAGTIGGESVILIRPLTFMNHSGRALASLYRDTEFTVEELLVCFDDLALPLGRLRIRPSGSAGGHNGMRSIIEHLGTEEFPRLRVGVFPESGAVDDASEFVLRPFRRRERTVIDDAIELAADAVECVLGEDLTTAMNRYNPEPL
jgi:PTH1 family peptidyl-tRNA hydrolase